MGKVSLEINGRKYALGCDDGEEERLESLGRKLDERIKVMANQFGQIGDLRLLVMAGISMTDELEESRQNLETQARELSDDIARKAEDELMEAKESEANAASALTSAALQIEKLATKLRER
ncbi:MAG: cell division protein ZapA [Robiginitomaculum sp.]|nr:MAG: cell division protein ZapA [Robiginitomaculum sp.]